MNIGPSPVDPIPEDVLRAAWAEHGHRLLDGPSVPWAFWAFDPRVPDELRVEPPTLYVEEDAERVRGERRELAERRREWLTA